MRGFKMTAVRSYGNDKMWQNCDAWKVVITNPRGQRMTRQYYMGKGFNGEAPKLEQVMESLITDASCYASSRNVADFHREFGYEEYSHALKAYNACKRTAERLETFLTPEEREHFTEQ